MGVKQKKNIWDWVLGRNIPLYVRVRRCALLILAGIPLFQFGMGALPGRDPSPQEIKILKDVFNDSADFSQLKIGNSPIAMTYMNILNLDATSFGNTILVREDLKDGFDSLPKERLYGIIHEAMHVRQTQNDYIMPLRAPWQAAVNYLTLHGRFHQYEYRLEEGKALESYGIEQQASILADYFNITRNEGPLFLINQNIDNDKRDRLYREALSDVINPILLSGRKSGDLAANRTP